MKKLLILLSIISSILLIGCDKILQEDEFEFRKAHANLPFDVYMIALSFHDASGNDLIAPLAEEQWKSVGDKNLSYWPNTINPERYHLDIILSNPHESWDNTIYNFRHEWEGSDPDKLQPYFKIWERGGLYMENIFDCPAINGRQESLTYEISCPTIFGDNTIHKLSTFWEYPSIASDNTANQRTADLYPLCFRATFDGQEVNVRKSVYYHTDYTTYDINLIDIVLNR
ncbi:MAG: hypothetical protein K6G53_05895 [Bacteroidales bacterium]|nr:hypothetical protein [Bacteroidales bacterium]